MELIRQDWGTGLIYCVSNINNSIARSWPKTTAHGSQRTTHDANGHVMTEKYQAYIDREKAEHSHKNPGFKNKMLTRFPYTDSVQSDRGAEP
jgi:hypothetical protein